MKVYLCYEDDENNNTIIYSISREWSFDSRQEAKAFCDGLNVGLQKGRCDVHLAILEDNLSVKIKERDLI